jgi:thiol-disulfide isomerase/thioredoxin
MTLREYIAALSRLDQDAVAVTYDGGSIYQSSVDGQPYRTVHHDRYGVYERCWQASDCPLCQLEIPTFKAVVIG